MCCRIASSAQGECAVNNVTIACTLKSVGIIDNNGTLDTTRLGAVSTLLGFPGPARTPKKNTEEAEMVLATLRERANAVCIRNKAAVYAKGCKRLAGLRARSAKAEEETSDE